MRTILYLIRKEFLQIFRNKFISKAIFGVPIVQMLIIGSCSYIRDKECKTLHHR